MEKMFLHMNKIKIFCIGHNKTGTTSLKQALINLKYSVCPIRMMFDSRTNYLIEFFENKYDKLFHLINCYDAFHDRPWNHLDFYKTLDQQIKNSLFILTIRNSLNWVKSYQRFAQQISLKKCWFYKLISNKLYNNDDFLEDENNMIQKYENRNQEIIQYFKQKNNLLVLDIEQGGGYKEICNFLKIPIFNDKFPHQRKTNNNI